MNAPPDTLGRGPASTRQQRQRPSIGRGYSRFVGVAKRILPGVAVLLLLLVAAWPRLQEIVEHIHVPLPRLDLTEVRDLRMVDAHYTGIDRQNRPFVVTADVARQNPGANDVVSLEEPKGNMKTQSGGWFQLTARTGVYQPQAQLLDLFGDVNLLQDKGNVFQTSSAHVDMAKGSAEGHEAVEGHGPFGHVTSQGFHVIDRGETIIFTGQSDLELLPHQKGQP
jgi:lipopolysaccharide export system protein LptC